MMNLMIIFEFDYHFNRNLELTVTFLYYIFGKQYNEILGFKNEI